MRPTIAINMPAPYVTLERYTELTGIKEDTARRQINEGRLPTKATPKGKSRSLIEINMFKLVCDAATEAGFDVQLVTR